MKTTLLIVISFVILSCSQNDKTPKSTWSKSEQLEKTNLVQAVMEVHDTTMTYMDSIHNSIKLLEKIKKASNDSVNNVEIDSAINMLEQADENMMDWMRNYREPKDTSNFETAKHYLMNQYEIIGDVEDMTMKSLIFSRQITKNENDSIN